MQENLQLLHEAFKSGKVEGFLNLNSGPEKLLRCLFTSDINLNWHKFDLSSIAFCNLVMGMLPKKIENIEVFLRDWRLWFWW